MALAQRATSPVTVHEVMRSPHLPPLIFPQESKYRGLGSTNGRLEGGRYFCCDSNCGVFVSLEALSRPEGCGEGDPWPDSQCCTPDPVAMEPVGGAEPMEGERVVVYDRNQRRHYGLVRGKEQSPSCGAMFRIEMVSLCSCNIIIP